MHVRGIYERTAPVWRNDETLEQAAQRVAVDAVYNARDRGGNMHDAGMDAADVVLALVASAK